jgi:hypothetical protein
MNKKIAFSTIAASTFAILALGIGIPLQEAQASHNGEPTMWVNGINSYQTHSYIYAVPAAGDLDMSVALLIKDMEEKPNVTLWTTDPLGVVTVCPIAPGTVGGGPANLLVSECFFSPPAPGIWTISITAGTITNNPVGYAIAADTTHP